MRISAVHTYPLAQAQLSPSNPLQPYAVLKAKFDNARGPIAAKDIIGDFTGYLRGTGSELVPKEAFGRIIGGQLMACAMHTEAAVDSHDAEYYAKHPELIADIAEWIDHQDGAHFIMSKVTVSANEMTWIANVTGNAVPSTYTVRRGPDGGLAIKAEKPGEETTYGYFVRHDG